MKFFIDTADISEIKQAHECGWVDGVTTNPSLVAKTKRPYHEVVQEIADLIDGPVNAEVTTDTAKEMFIEGKSFAQIGKDNGKGNIVVKVPMTVEGLKAVRMFSKEGIATNVTLVFQPLQALMCAKAGASYVSPFVGRLDDISSNGMDMVSHIQTLFSNYGFETEILVASVRHPIHVLEAGLIGADVVTLPFKVIKQLLDHPLTNIGIDKFAKDYEKHQKNIQ